MKLASLMADRKLPNMEILNLENNEIDEESTHFLSCSITSETVPNLQEFLIGGNPIGDKGVTHLFRYFRSQMNGYAFFQFKFHFIVDISQDNIAQ